jgi:hypothetical protein
MPPRYELFHLEICYAIFCKEINKALIEAKFL